MNRILIIILLQLLFFVSFSQDKSINAKFDIKLEAEYLIKTNNFIEAVELLSNYLDTNIKNAEIFYLRARSLNEIANTKNAISDLSKAIELSSDNYKYFALRGEIYFSDKKYKKAFVDYTAAYNFEGENDTLLLKKSISAYFSKNYKIALDNFEIYLKNKPTDNVANYYCGLINYQQDNIDKSLEYADKALKENKSQYEYFLLRGNVYFQKGLYEKANQDFGMALDLAPRNGEIYFHRANSRFELGNKDGACADWEKAYRYKFTDAHQFLKKHCW